MNTAAPITFTADEFAATRAWIAAGSPYVPPTAKSYLCDMCDTITFNQPEDGDVLCDLCSPDAYHASVKCLGCGDRMPDADPDEDVYCDDCLPGSWS